MDFVTWPKTPRLFRDVVLTEKIDGTNAAVVIEEIPEGLECPDIAVAEVKDETKPFDTYFAIGAQSRKRLITRKADNFGFANWVADNAETLYRDLGPGRHYGEWWGSGIQRGYGLPKGQKLFSLFNVTRYEAGSERFETSALRVVPVLRRCMFSEFEIHRTLRELGEAGSLAAYREGVRFGDPEGIITFHTSSNSVFKTTFDDNPKGE